MGVEPRKLSPEQPQNLDTRLFHAAENGRPADVRRLLAAGADVHACNDFALRCASLRGDADIVRVLLAAGANVRAENDDALRCAAAKGHTETVRALLAAGADARAMDEYPLCVAAQLGHVETVKVLAQHIFAPERWAAKSRADIEAAWAALYDKMKPEASPEHSCQVSRILADCVRACREQVISPLPDCTPADMAHLIAEAAEAQSSPHKPPTRPYIQLPAPL